VLLGADAALGVGQSAATGSGWNAAGGKGSGAVSTDSAKLIFVQHCLFFHVP
jgi:hypothetical protein